MRRNKYNAKPTHVDGIRFDSKREARRYQDLKLLERAGEITKLQLQPVFAIAIDGIPVRFDSGRKMSYKADFAYYTKDGNRVVEDVKGMKTDVYKIKKALIEHIYGIKIREI